MAMAGVPAALAPVAHADDAAVQASAGQPAVLHPAGVPYYMPDGDPC